MVWSFFHFNKRHCNSVLFTVRISWCVPCLARKKISEDHRSKVVDVHVAGKVTKLQSLDIDQSTVRDIVYRWRRRRRSWVMQQDHDHKHWSKSIPERPRYIKFPLWSQNTSQQKCFEISSRDMFAPDILRIWLSWSGFIRKNDPKVLVNIV